MSNPRTAIEREAIFWLRVQKSDTPDGCWLWTGGQTSQGGNGTKYGSFKYPGGTLAHRYSWELANGRPATPGLHVCHHCDNPLCVRPDHLYSGTQQRNMRDAGSRGRLHHAGEKNPRAKLTAEKVLAIRRDTRAPSIIAFEHGVTPQMIYRIQSRLAWQSLPEEIQK